MAKWARDMVVFFVAWMYALTFEKQPRAMHESTHHVLRFV